MDPCTPAEHDTWLSDLRRWREERRIRVGYEGSRYDLPAQVDAVQLFPAADDDPWPLLL